MCSILIHLDLFFELLNLFNDTVVNEKYRTLDSWRRKVTKHIPVTPVYEFIDSNLSKVMVTAQFPFAKKCFFIHSPIDTLRELMSE